MTRPIELRPEAVAEMRQAFGWYEEKQRGLGLQFLFAVDATLDRIRRQPDLFPFVQRLAQKALLRRFPFAVLFVDEPDRITVIAIYHGRRKPLGWSGRVSEPEVVAFGSATGDVVRRSGVS